MSTDSQIVLKGYKQDLHVPLVATGTWSWSDKTWQYVEERDLPGIKEVFASLRKSSTAFLDTAEVYGNGGSEKIIGNLLKEMPAEERSQIIIATKWLPSPMLPWRWWPRGAAGSCKSSLQRLQLDSIDLYQTHSPWTYFFSHKTAAKGLASIVKQGLAKAVGVSNYSKDEMIAMYDYLKAEGVPLATNQVEYSLLRTLPDVAGLIAAARERNIVILAYSPLGQGRLTGKYSAANPPPKERYFSAIPMEEIEPLLVVMREIAAARDVTCSAVALNWVICKGAIPLGGARNAKQVEQNAQALSFRLSDEEMARLDALAMVGKTSMWQRG